MTIRKAVFPVAGLGTRFLPATKANPKEMLPIVDKPLIQFAAEEAVAAGITELIFVTSSAKRAIEDHFDTNYELEASLLERDQMGRLSIVRDILPPGVTAAYIRQHRPLGLGHAISCAAPFVGQESFAVLLADDLIESSLSCLSQLVSLYEKETCAIVAVEKIQREDADKYGIVDVLDQEAAFSALKGIVEKPHPDQAPSSLAAVGRYILTPAIFKHLAATQRGRGGEIQLTDAIASLLGEERVLAYAFDGKRYDCGTKMGYLQATVHYGCQHAELGEEFKAFLRHFGNMLN